MPNPKMIRVSVVQHLAKEALDAMDGCGVGDLTVAELTSACFTLTKNVVHVLMDSSDDTNREQNANEVRDALMSIYELVKPKDVH